MSNGCRARASPICVATFAAMAVGCADAEKRTSKDAEPPAPTGDAAIVARIDAIAMAALADGPLAGLSIAVVRGQDMIVSKGYGYADLAAKVPATADTMYDIASITKLFTAAAIMKLAQAGKVDLADELASLLPEFPNAEQARRITVRHLLNHTSGLSDYEAAHTEYWLAGGKPVTPTFVLDYLSGRPLEFVPGSQWSYSNSGYYLLGMIVERVSGRRYGEYVRDEIAAPLKLSATAPCDLVFGSPAATRGYDAKDSGLVASRLIGAPNIVADGGLCSTVGDLSRLPTALARGNVVNAASLAAMREPTTLASGIAIDYGLGVRRGVLEGHELWGHTGGMDSYWSVLARYPDDDVTIVVLVNTEGADEDALTIAGNVARVVLRLGEPVLADLPVTPKEAAAYAGTYQRSSDRIRIYAEAGHLRRAVEGSERPPGTLLCQAQGSFAFTVEYPMDRLVFHVVGDRAVGSSEYYNGIFAEYSNRVDQ
jgi:CubicO group peptidase (beta-lactamase class C family)